MRGGQRRYLSLRNSVRYRGRVNARSLASNGELSTRSVAEHLTSHHRKWRTYPRAANAHTGNRNLHGMGHNAPALRLSDNKAAGENHEEEDFQTRKIRFMLARCKVPCKTKPDKPLSLGPSPVSPVPDQNFDWRRVVFVGRVVELGTIADHHQHVHFGAQFHVLSGTGNSFSE